MRRFDPMAFDVWLGGHKTRENHAVYARWGGALSFDEWVSTVVPDDFDAYDEREG